VKSDLWSVLRRFTQARIALGRAGHAMPTAALLEFQLAHAEARDAVHLVWDLDGFADRVRGLGAQVLLLETPVASRDEYLRRPDLGRILNGASRERLGKLDCDAADVALIVTNGLSTAALERHGIALLRALLNGYRSRQLSVAPVALVANGRVALLDEIGSALGAKVAVIVVGERPGLSAADSLGVYLGFAPKPGNSDAQRNCISNIRPPEGLSYQDAAAKIIYLTEESMRRGTSGVALKDDTAGLLTG